MVAGQGGNATVTGPARYLQLLLDPGQPVTRLLQVAVACPFHLTQRRVGVGALFQ
jgi:hypothetical protein